MTAEADEPRKRRKYTTTERLAILKTADKVGPIEAARHHGVAVDERAAREHSAKVFGQVRGYEGLITAGGIDVFAHGYAALAVHAGNLGPNISTAVLAKRFSNLQSLDGHWIPIDFRPPHSQSHFAATALAVRVIGLYLPEQLASERHDRFARARRRSPRYRNRCRATPRCGHLRRSG